MAGKFENLNESINTVLVKILESQDLCKLIYYLDTDPTSGEDLSDTSILLFDSIFPYPFTPNVTDEEKVILNVFFDGFEKNDNNFYFKNNLLIIDILCSSGVWKIDAGLRPFSIMHKLDLLFNDKKVIKSLGKMQYSNTKFIFINQKFNGYSMRFKFIDS